MPSGRVLIIDDDPEVGAFTSEVARNLGLQALRVDRSEQVVAAFREFHPDTIVLDLMMPGMDGIQVLRALADENCQADILLFSGADGRLLNTTARLAAQQGLRIRELLRKPVQVEDLELALRRPGRAAPASEDELRTAIRAGQITAHFQPKVCLKAPEEWVVEGVEALARWEHPEHGLVPPADFIPLVEQSGLIGDLTEVIADRALGLARRLRRDGMNLDVALNLSPLLLDDGDLPDRFARKLDDYGVDHSRLILEVTESAAMGNNGAAMENLARIRVKGMKLSMDDFGTGYSSLVQLHRMPFSELKIDRSFVMEADTDAEARVIIQATVRLAQSLGLQVCAEGVESRKSLSFLRSIGCDQAQGYLISKSLPEDDLLAFLRTCRQARDPGAAAG